MQALKKRYPENSVKSLDQQLACVRTPLPRAPVRFYQSLEGQFLANKCIPTSSTFDNLPSFPDSNNLILCFGQFSIEQKKIEMLFFLFREHLHFILLLKSSFLPPTTFFLNKLSLNSLFIPSSLQKYIK